MTSTEAVGTERRMQIQSAADSVTAYEYGCDLRRLYPWDGVAGPGWGSAIASVRPGECTTPHAHDELETFLVLDGSGRMDIEDEHAVLHRGDVVLIPKNQKHSFRNLSESDPLVFLSIFWDSPEARARLNVVLDQGSDDL